MNDDELFDPFGDDNSGSDADIFESSSTLLGADTDEEAGYEQISTTGDDLQPEDNDDDQDYGLGTTDSKSPRKTIIIIGVIALVILLCSSSLLIAMKINSRNQAKIEPTAPPILKVEVTETATPSPTAVPPTPTSLPTSTPTPIPAVVKIEGPVTVPVNMPSSVKWTVTLLTGDNTQVAITQLGNAMLTTNDLSEVVIRRTLAINNLAAAPVWDIAGVVDPNTGGGVLTLEIKDTAGNQSLVDLPWAIGDIPAVQYDAQTITVSNAANMSLPEPNVDAKTLPAVIPDGYALQEGSSWRFLYPDDWYIGTDGNVTTAANNPRLITNEPGPGEIGAYVVMTEEYRDATAPEDVLRDILADKDGMDQLSIQSLYVNNIPAAFVGFSGKDDAGDFQGIIAVLLDGNEAMLILGMTYDETEPDVLLHILNSVERK